MSAVSLVAMPDPLVAGGVYHGGAPSVAANP